MRRALPTVPITAKIKGKNIIMRAGVAVFGMSCRRQPARPEANPSGGAGSARVLLPTEKKIVFFVHHKDIYKK